MYTTNKDDNIASLKNTGKEARAIANEAVDEAKQGLRVVANRAGRKVRDFIHTAEDEFVHARDSVTTQIRTKPVQSSLIALGAGLLLGALLRRR